MKLGEVVKNKFIKASVFAMAILTFMFAFCVKIKPNHLSFASTENFQALSGYDHIFVDKTKSGVAGTLANPYVLNSAESIIELSNNISYSKLYLSCFVVQDFDGNPISNIVLTKENGFVPIGHYENLNSTGFQGVFDGKGCNFEIYYDEYDQPYGGSGVGLFGYVKNRSIKNEEQYCTQIKNLSISGEIKGYENVGAIAGICSGKIYNCYSTAKITGSTNAGGIVGKLTSSSSTTNSSVENCLSKVELCCNKIVGGVVGLISGNVNVKDCVFYGDIVTEQSTDDFFKNVGGCIGSGIESTYTNYFTTGNFTDKQQKLSARIGEVQYSAFDMTHSTEDHFQTLDFVTENNDDGIWIKETKYYPRLAYFSNSSNVDISSAILNITKLNNISQFAIDSFSSNRVKDAVNISMGKLKDITLTVEVSGDFVDTGDLVYEWFFVNEDGIIKKLDNEKSTLTLTSPNQTGKYFVVSTLTYDGMTTTAKSKVLNIEITDNSDNIGAMLWVVVGISLFVVCGVVTFVLLYKRQRRKLHKRKKKIIKQ